MTVTAEAAPPSATGSTEPLAPAPVEPPRPVPAALAPWRDPSPLIGWAMTALVFGVAAVSRLWALGWPIP